MKYINIMILVGFILSGCTSTGVDATQSGTPYMYKGMNFGYDRDANYKLGVVDGCRTATGAYKKNHELFNPLGNNSPTLGSIPKSPIEYNLS